MALVSPGVQVTVKDESVYAPTAAATVPLVILATASNKTTPNGTIAEGTVSANAGDLYLLTSQRDVLNFFGTPQFYTNTNNNPIHGYELNEYGLMTVYRLLGATSRCYVLRADIDLGALIGLTGRPLADPDDMTYWLDLTPTRWGIFFWDSVRQEFINVIPTVITDSTDLSGGFPKASIGQIGSFAIDGTNPSFPLFQKNIDNDWVLVGGEDWQDSIPTIIGAFPAPTLTAGHSIEINGTIVTFTGTTATQVASDINSASITGISASVYRGSLQIYANQTAMSDGSTVDGAVSISDDSGTGLADLGILQGKYYRPILAQSAHTQVPEWKSADSQPRPYGSVWIKTTGANAGASISVKRYNELTGRFIELAAPLYLNDETANKWLDPLNGGRNIPIGNVYVQYDVREDGTATYKVFDRVRTGPTILTSTALLPTFTPGDSFEIAFSFPNRTVLTDYVEIVMSGSTSETFVEDIIAAQLSNITAQINSDGSVSIIHLLGGVMRLRDKNNTPLSDAGITFANDFARQVPDTTEIIASNWVATEIQASISEPGTEPADRTPWYWGEVGEVDIMIHDGRNWRGYKNVSIDARGYNLSNTDPLGPISSATEPTAQSDGSALQFGDLWIDTSDLENYPKLYRYEFLPGDDVDDGGTWIEVDLTDQTSENGILFADARFMGDDTSDVIDADITTIESLLTNDYLDLDAPDPQLYPRGMLLWNTRRSSFNVKEYRRNHFNGDDFPGQILPQESNSWVSISGFRQNGHAYFGRKAQRSVIAAAMTAAVDSNTEIREEQREFNLIAAPGYPELIGTMTLLNSDRKYTAFVVGDSPFRLPSEGTRLTDWLLNSELEGVDNEDALTTRDSYTGVWYPSLLDADLSGNQVALPPSFGVLPMIIKNDEDAFPWFAPAGTTRGRIKGTNTRLGYLTDTNEFVTIGVRQGVRDVLYENNVNPLMYTPQTGIIAMGQKTRHPFASALDRINVARLICYMRLQLDKIVRPFLFEPNDKITRDEVKGVVESFCNDLVTKRGLYDYLVVCDESNNTPDRIDRNELYIDVYIEPVKAVEFIYIPIRIKNTGEIEGGL